MHVDNQTIPCFFLHDSLMAAFQEEQTFFRLQFLTSGKASPFSIIPPLCPCTDITDPVNPEIGRLVADEGWILHPCNYTGNRSDYARNRQTPSPALSPAGFILPGYPPLPHTAGFILGYAGDRAAKLLDMVCPGSDKLPATPFPVKFWYRANVTINCTQDQETGTIFAEWTIGERIKESRSR